MTYLLVIVMVGGAWVSGYFIGYYHGVRKGAEAPGRAPEPGGSGSGRCTHPSKTAYQSGMVVCDECGEIVGDPFTDEAERIKQSGR